MPKSFPGGNASGFLRMSRGGGVEVFFCSIVGGTCNTQQDLVLERTIHEPRPFPEAGLLQVTTIPSLSSYRAEKKPRTSPPGDWKLKKPSTVLAGFPPAVRNVHSQYLLGDYSRLPDRGCDYTLRRSPMGRLRNLLVPSFCLIGTLQ